MGYPLDEMVKMLSHFHEKLKLENEYGCGYTDIFDLNNYETLNGLVGYYIGNDTYRAGDTHIKTYPTLSNYLHSHVRQKPYKFTLGDEVRFTVTHDMKVSEHTLSVLSAVDEDWNFAILAVCVVKPPIAEGCSDGCGNSQDV